MTSLKVKTESSELGPLTERARAAWVPGEARRNGGDGGAGVAGVAGMAGMARKGGSNLVGVVAQRASPPPQELLPLLLALALLTRISQRPACGPVEVIDYDAGARCLMRTGVQLKIRQYSVCWLQSNNWILDVCPCPREKMEEEKKKERRRKKMKIERTLPSRDMGW